MRQTGMVLLCLQHLKGASCIKMTEDFDLVSKLDSEEERLKRFRLRCISPDDGKYGETGDPLREYLTAEAEWRECARMQLIFLETRAEFGKAKARHVEELRKALPKIDPLNISLLENDKRIRHDQLAVIEEIGRHVSPEVKSLLHPGTTSYDTLDSVRSYLFREAWKQVIRPKVKDTINLFCNMGRENISLMQVGRTHLQYTSPVTVGSVMGVFARRLGDRVQYLDRTFGSLKGKVSGIVGTGASIDMVIGLGRSEEFERAVLRKIGLEPDLAATQIVQKERLADVGNGLVTIAYVLGSFAEDMRRLYSSDIEEVTSLANAERLGGSSAAAGKNNPIDWENIAGTVPEIESGMRVLYSLIQSDHQRDLRGSKSARYQPQTMMDEVYQMFSTAVKSLPDLFFRTERIAEHLQRYAEFPDEATTAILRGAGYVHPEHGDGHTFVKIAARNARKSQRGLLEVALEDEHFRRFYERVDSVKQRILSGILEDYLGHTKRRAEENFEFAMSV